MSFVIFALPRSRTAWLARFLTYREWQCGHDEAVRCRSMADVASWFDQPCTGTVETAAAPFWRLLPDGAKAIVIRRPVADVVASLMRLSPEADEAAITASMVRIDRKLDQIERRVPGVLSIYYAELATEDGCRRLWAYCLPYDFDPLWWGFWRGVDVQVNVGLVARYYQAHRPQLEKLAKVARHQAIAAMRPAAAEFDGVTFQVEPFREFYQDAEHLFEEHLVQTEQSPDDHVRKNLPLMARLDDSGFLQCLTARIQQRMVGYLMTVISPTLDDRHKIVGEHTIFFASKDVRGLGMRLQRAALEALRERGVSEVILRAGHRGSGPRLGTFYRRLGAEPFGELYRLEI